MIFRDKNINIEKLTKKLSLKKIHPETEDAASLTFAIPDSEKGAFKYRAGQFITLFLNLEGKDVRRSYSLSSSPEVDKDFTITVKRVKGGLVSNYLLDQVKEGQEFNVTPPAGNFCLPNYIENRAFVFYAAGSGITPIISLIKSVLSQETASGKKPKCFLFYANRNENSIIFHRELLKLNSDYPNQFKMEYFLSSPLKPWSGPTGRVSSKSVETFLNENKIPKDALHFLCGPDGFMATIQAALELKGFTKSSIVKESFVSPQEVNPKNEIPNKEAPLQDETTGPLNTATDKEEIHPEATDDATYIGDRKNLAACKEIEVVLDGETQTVTYTEGLSILESLLEAGLNAPYSCMNGACMACLGKINEGCAYQEDLGILTEDNVEAHECLTCQARPATKKIKINYDSI